MTPDERGASASVLLPSSCTKGFAASTSSTYLLVWQVTRQEMTSTLEETKEFFL